LSRPRSDRPEGARQAAVTYNKSVMIKDPMKHLRLSERDRARKLARMSVREKIRIGEDLIRAYFRHHKPRMRHDRPRALAFFLNPNYRP